MWLVRNDRQGKEHELAKGFSLGSATGPGWPVLQIVPDATKGDHFIPMQAPDLCTTYRGHHPKITLSSPPQRSNKVN